MKKRTINPIYIDLFAGCGGLSLGLHKAGWKGLFAVEKNIDAFKTFKHNLLDKKEYFKWPSWLPKENHDIEKIIREYKSELSQLRGKIDLVAGGPPCQGFSSAGRRNENDQRNNLVKSYIRFIRLTSPKVIFFENVKGFTQEFRKNKDKGKRYSNYVENALKRSGYTVKGKLVNFGDFGIPQKRTRFILVGIRNDVAESNRKETHDFFESICKNKSKFLINRGLSLNTKLEDAISDLLKDNGTVSSPDSVGFKAGIYSSEKSQYQKYLRKGAKKTIPDSHRFANHREDVKNKFQYFLNNSKIKNKNIGQLIRDKYNIKKRTIIVLDKDGKSPTITTLPDDYIHYSEARILTVREYARIQSFPDWYEFLGKYTTGGRRRIMEVPRYSQIGNAIPPLFAEQAGKVLRKLVTQ